MDISLITSFVLHFLEKRQGSIWEQTICVPTVLNWKGRIKDRWLISTPVTVMDVMPSVLELLNVSSAAVHTDGKSLLPVLLNTSQESQHEYIFHYVEVTKPAAVTTGPYKLIYTDTKGNYIVYNSNKLKKNNLLLHWEARWPHG